jgi:hypothetical protein
MKKHLRLFTSVITSLFLLSSVVQAQTPFAPLGGPIIETREIDTTFNIQMNYIFGSLFKNLVPYGILRDYAMEFSKKL